MKLLTKTAKKRFLQSALALPPSSWDEALRTRLAALVRHAFVDHSADLYRSPYTVGVAAAFFREAPVILFPGRTVSTYARFGAGFAWANEQPLLALHYLVRTVLEFLSRPARIRVQPVPAELTKGFNDLRDTNCCVPLATSILCRAPYADSFAAWSALGRKHRRGTPTRRLLGDEKTILGHRFVRAGSWAFRGEAPTVSRWLANHPRGSYLLLVAHHGLAVVDGVPIDHTPLKPRGLVRAAYRVERL